MKKIIKFFCFILIAIVLILIALKEEFKNVNSLKKSSEEAEKTDCGIYGCIDDYLDFEGFNNTIGVKEKIVPDIVHLIYLQQTQLNFSQVICLFSIYYNHKPGLIFIHCDNCTFHGKYWEWVKAEPDLWKLIKIHQVPYKKTIFGREYGYIQHRADVWRLLLLMNYGGMYLDNDMYVINSLHKYRHFEMTVSWQDRNDGIGNQVLIAHRNARFLRTYFDSYRYNYDGSCWYCNGGFFPAKILKNYEYLIHIVNTEWGTQNLFGQLYKMKWDDWKKLDSIHLLINHRWYLDEMSPIKEFDEFNILNYNFTFGYMAREIMKKMKRL